MSEEEKSESVPAPIPKNEKAYVTLSELSAGSYRLFCEDVAERLAKNSSFSWKVIWKTVLLFTGVLAVMGFSIYQIVNENIKETVSKRIDKEFEQENIKKLVQESANAKAEDILKKSVQPSIEDFKGYLAKQRESIDKKVESLQQEIKNLKKVGEISQLAAKAIGDGDIVSYKKLEHLAFKAENLEDRAIATSELFRVFNAYSPFGPVRWVGVHVIPESVNPKKTREEDLDAEDLCKLLQSNPKEPEGRGQTASLLLNVVKVKSYKTSVIIADALKRETHLEVIRRLKSVFRRITDCPEDGTLLADQSLEWWEKNKDRLKKEDSDKTNPEAKK
jgi:hypothetical protein